ncbi:MAG: sugar kinase [Anaerolineaceae bacterium]|nr:sugar kinase [Anaerolineaceae bacterium]
MALDLLIVGEALVEVMRTGIDQPLHQPGPFIGPYPSGAPFICAVQAARLGLSVGAIGSVGQDAFGQCLLNQLSADQIMATGMHTLPDRTTGVAFVAYNADGSRNFVFSLGAGGDLSPDMLDPALFDGLRCLHLMGSTLSMSQHALETGRRALALAQENGARFSFDPNLRPEMLPIDQARTAFAPFIAAADVLIPTADELVALTQQPDLNSAVDSLLADNPQRIIVVTEGEAGCTVYSQQGVSHVPGFTVTEVDPTGAGDCFDAGFLAGWLGGQSLTNSARLGNACGALAVTQQGPMAGAAQLAAVRDFMASQN